MIELSYSISPIRNKIKRPELLSNADDSALHYDLFLGYVRLKGSGVDLSPRWDWTPLIDFSVCIRSILEALKKNGDREKFEFTESDAHLDFHRVGHDIEISASYTTRQLKGSFSDFSLTAMRAAKQLHDELARQYPALLENKRFNQMLLSNGIGRPPKS